MGEWKRQWKLLQRLGFRVYDLGFKVSGLGVWGLGGLGLQGLRFRVLGFRV